LTKPSLPQRYGEAIIVRTRLDMAEEGCSIVYYESVVFQVSCLYFIFSSIKKRAKAKGKKKCHTETMKGRKSRYNLYIREPLSLSEFFFSQVLGPLLPCPQKTILDVIRKRK
jgi:hypothetical protein